MGTSSPLAANIPWHWSVMILLSKATLRMGSTVSKLKRRFKALLISLIPLSRVLAVAITLNPEEAKRNPSSPSSGMLSTRSLMILIRLSWISRGQRVISSKRVMTLGRVLILADSAHGYGASRNGHKSGQCADFTSFSFHAVKNFTTGEGGGLVWRELDGIDDEEIYKKIMLMSLHGQSKDALAKTKLGAWEYDIIAPLYKCNMTDITAAIGLAQMTRYEGMLARRKQMINMYTEGIKADDVECLCHYTDEYSSSGHLFLTRLLGRDVEDRNQFIIRMAEAGIATNVHFKPLPMHTAYKQLGFDIKDFPKSFEMYHNEVTLPLHTNLTDEQIEYVIENFNSLK